MWEPPGAGDGEGSLGARGTPLGIRAELRAPLQQLLRGRHLSLFCEASQPQFWVRLETCAFSLSPT